MHETHIILFCLPYNSEILCLWKNSILSAWLLICFLSCLPALPALLVLFGSISLCMCACLSANQLFCQLIKYTLYFPFSPSISLSLLSFFFIYFYIYLYLSVFFSIYLSNRVSIYFFICIPAFLSTFLLTFLSIYQPVCLYSLTFSYSSPLPLHCSIKSIIKLAVYTPPLACMRHNLPALPYCL